MDKPIIKERRKSMRVTMINPAAWLIDPFLNLIDISNGGAFIATDQPITPKDKDTITSVDIMLPDNLGPFSIPCEVVRIQWISTKNRSKGYAVKFIINNENTRKILYALLIYIKNNQIITVSKRLMEEVFKRPPIL